MQKTITIIGLGYIGLFLVKSLLTVVFVSSLVNN
jgi:UDP-N-acetyl-D-mannosaminuronate dehydrogenase